jgi:hypothetical protein
LPVLLGHHSYYRVCAVIESLLGFHGYNRPWSACDNTSLVFLEKSGKVVSLWILLTVSQLWHSASFYHSNSLHSSSLWGAEPGLLQP